jgi:AcrR family transcriptional regulator
MKHALKSKERSSRLDILVVAERLFAEIGFEKTTVSDIASELRMSPANIYRFFSSKAEVNEGVGSRLLSVIVGAGDKNAAGAGLASEKLRAFLAAIERANADRFLSNRKLHDLLETAFSQNWPIAQKHIEKITKSLSEIISQGNRDGEFAVSECDLAALLVRSACIRFWHPRLMVEGAQDPEPTLDQMINFCLGALAHDAPVTQLSLPTARACPRFHATPPQ